MSSGNMSSAFRSSPAVAALARVAVCVLAVVAVTAVVVGMAGCGGRTAQAPGPDPTVSPTSAGTPIASASPVPAGSASPTPVYRAVGNLCPIVDVSPLRRLTGPAQPQPAARINRTPVSTVMACTIPAGSYGNAGAVIAVAEVFTDRPATAAFEQLRDAEDNVAPVTGLGTDAYSYVDAGGRPVVVAYHANLHVLVQYVPNTVLNNPQQLVGALVEICRSVIAGLNRLTYPSATPNGWRRPT